MPIGRDRFLEIAAASKKGLQPTRPQGGLVRYEVNLVINEDILRRDTVRLITTIDAQIDEVAKEAKRMGIDSVQLRDSHGNWVLTPLLLAKAQAYGTLVLLQSNHKK